MSILLVLSNLPDRPAAETLARALVEERAAACVSILPGCLSVYRWKGEVEQAEEVPILIKTTADSFPRVEEIVRRLHPYELPEIVAVPVTAGLAAYLEWVAAETVPAQP